MKIYQNTKTKKSARAIQAGYDIIPRWLLNKVTEGEVVLLQDTPDIVMKIGTKTVSKSDYVINIANKLTIMSSDKFEASYTPVEYTDETAVLWETE